MSELQCAVCPKPIFYPTSAVRFIWMKDVAVGQRVPVDLYVHKRCDAERITVCGECHRAACWQGTFMCESARLAGTTEMTVGQLRRGDFGEHPDYWRKHLRETHSEWPWGSEVKR